MAEYVDGFVIAVPKKKLGDYKKDALLARKLWMEYGALDYRECVADALDVQYGKTFKKLLALKPDETVIFAWITHKSKSARDRTNKKVMSDPRLQPSATKREMPFKMNRMSFGGFRTLVKA